MGALGYVMQVPEEEKYLNTKKELEAMLVGYLGGRAAEELVFDTVTTGAANDIEQATKVARAMITQYGMSDKFGLMGLATQENQYLSGRTVLNCGDDTATEVDPPFFRFMSSTRMVWPSFSALSCIGESCTPPRDCWLNAWSFGNMNSIPLLSALYCKVALNSFPWLDFMPSTKICSPFFSFWIFVRSQCNPF